MRGARNARGAALAAASLVASLLGPSGAVGDPVNGWSFAHWGMTRSQVRVASHGAVRPPPADEEDTGTDGVDGDYAFGPFKVAVKLEFGDDHRLSQVDFFPVGDHVDCAAIGPYLTQAYGPMLRDSGGRGLRTRSWVNGDNVVNWRTEGPGYTVCEIDYDPRPLPAPHRR